MKLQQITVHTPSGHYAVVYGRGTLGRAGATISALAEGTGTVLLSSARVWKHWGRRVEASFAGFGGARHILFDDREAAKSLGTVEKLLRALARAGADRECILVALGGGVVGDVAGFAAAAYQRGVRCVQVPTTLVAQVDSAVGGKTGVNLPEGKNLVGAFHQPRLVVVDPEALRTLPERHYRAGVYEVLKYGIIADAGLFHLLEARLERLLKKDAATVDEIIPRCISIKADVVSEDERETDRRRILNFGHTFGHALEAETDYRHFLHGEAVGWGMVAAARLARELGLLAAGEAERIEKLVHRAGALPPLPRMAPERLLARMRGDKKARAGRVHFVLPRRIGKVEVVADVPETAVTRVLGSLGVGRGRPDNAMDAARLGGWVCRA